MNDLNQNAYLVAKWQKQIIWLVLACLLCMYVRFGLPFVGIYCAYAMYQLASALKSRIAIIWALLCFVPFIGLLSLFFLNQRATVALREAGIRVGFMGVSETDLDKLSGSAATPPPAPPSPSTPSNPPEAVA